MYAHDGTWTRALTHLECGRRSERYDADVPQNVCHGRRIEEVLVLTTGRALKHEGSLRVGRPLLLSRDADLPPYATIAADPADAAGSSGAERGRRTPR